MVKKWKGVHDDAPPVRKRSRNRASPFAVVKLYESMSNAQKAAVVVMELDSMLHIKCQYLHNPLIHWLKGLYDKNSREFVIPGRGRIPLNEDSAFRTLGLPLGSQPVVYAVDSKTEAQLGPVLFPKDGNTPLVTRVFEILKDMEEGEVEFKQIWVMYIVSTILAPTTSNHVSNRCYPIMANIENVHKLQWCKFVVDRLHDELSKGKVSKACLLFMQLLYVDSLDISGLHLNLPDGRFAINIWSTIDINLVLSADLQYDGSSYGKLELKREFGLDYTLFGGAVGFQKWFDTCTDPSCTTKQKEQVANLMGTFASGIVGLMGSLVQGWIALPVNAGVEMSTQFGHVAKGILRAGPSSSNAAARVTRGSTAKMKGAHTTLADARKSKNVLHDSSDDESSGDDQVDRYIRVPRNGKEPRVGDGPIPTPPSDAAHGATPPSDAARGATPPLDAARGATPPLDAARVDNQGSKVIADRDVAKQPVLRVYKSSKSKKKLKTVRQIDNEVRAIVCDELGLDAGLILSSPPNKPTGTNVLKKATPKRKEVPRGKAVLAKTQGTRSSPRLAKNRYAGVTISQGIADVIDIDRCSPKVSPHQNEGAADMDTLLCDGDETLANTEAFESGAPYSEPPGNMDDLPVCNTAAAPAPSVVSASYVEAPVSAQLGANVVVSEAGATESLAMGTAALPVPNAAILPVFNVQPVSAQLQDKSANAGFSTVINTSECKAAVVSDATITTAHKVAVNAEYAKHIATDGSVLVSALTLFSNLSSPAGPNVQLPEDQSKDAANVEEDSGNKGSPGSVVPASTLFYDMDPVWNFTSQSPVREHAVQPSRYDVDPTDSSKPSSSIMAGLNNESSPAGPRTDVIPEGIPITARAGVSSSTNENAPGDLFHVFESDQPLPMSWAFPTSLVKNQPVAPVKGKMPVKDNSKVISLDDLFIEKIGGEGFDRSIDTKHNCSQKTEHAEDVHTYSTPAISTAGPFLVPVSITPRTRLRTVRVIQPSKALLSPFSYVTTSKHEDSLYEKVIIHTYDQKKSRIKGSRILHIEPTWVTTGELAGSMMPNGELSNTVCDIGISVLQDSCSEKKVIFPYIVTKYLLERKFDTNLLRKHFRKDNSYKLSHKDLISFLVLQELGTRKKPCGHWYMLSINMPAKRFEILDSLRGEDDVGLIEHANVLVDGIKSMYRLNYSDSRRQIDNFELMYIPVPKQLNGTDCGFFMLKFLELWNGSVVPAIFQEQIPALRKKLTTLWLEHPRNELINWKYLLDSNVF